mmetsp:Transcript_37709/g.92683  ORF Transcript_37709/g.92683 Transcript_37709/m.92683 type:complete len:272 (-) Transcript_37709:61-876(-)
MAPPEGVRAAQGHDLLIIEAHPPKGVPEVLRGLLGAAFVRVWQAPIGCGLLGICGVLTAPLPVDVGPPERLDCNCPHQGVQVRVRHLGVLGLEGLEPHERLADPGVGLVLELLIKPEGALGRPSRLGELVIGATRVEGHAHHRGPEVDILHDHLDNVLAQRLELIGGRGRGEADARLDLLDDVWPDAPKDVIGDVPIIRKSNPIPAEGQGSEGRHRHQDRSPVHVARSLRHPQRRSAPAPRSGSLGVAPPRHPCREHICHGQEGHTGAQRA